ncbi:MAG: hypothetical protein GC203_03120 [Phenylobacterium sp.]|uniref:hypothetical protein n=1 Tax=Phenylobacterium sp. TaxID=1871053 RepID=UPI0025E14B92|nr:hypothetical protein [Phenylobacterium sp.]MBI1196832.1 hypothetical protein [Phenylobacterium sp.]
MKTLIAALAAATAVAAVAGPAAAHPDGYNHGRYVDQRDYRDHRAHRDPGVNARQAQAERRIEHGLRTGALTAREARRLREEARDIARLEARYRRGGFNWNERAELDRRLDRLEWNIARESHDRDYGYGYGYRR